MTTYKEVKGATIQTLDSDPVVNAGSWSAGGNMNTARELFASAGTVHTAALASAGYNGSTNVNNVEQYDGTSWTEVAEVNTARYYLTGFGSSTAALAIGGTPPVTTKTELWNGSAWTEVNDLTRGPTSPQASVYMMSSGASTSGLVYGGDEGASNKSALTESWDGTNWTEVGDLNTSRSYGAGSGTTNTAALCLSGLNWTPSLSQSPLVEQYNGSSWTEIADVNTARSRQAASNYGGVSTTLMFGGSPDNSTVVGNTESWDGSSWTEVNDLGTARWGVGGSGISTNALAFGGAGPPSSRLSATEEWTFPPVTAATLNEGMIFLSGGITLKGFGKAAGIPAATWATGGNLNTARGNNPSSTGGTQTAAMLAGGGYPTSTANTELYNGSSWTEVNNLNQARSNAAVGGTSTLTVLGLGYIAPSPGNVNNTETWDGTNWTAGNTANTARGLIGGFGVYNSAVATGGTPGTSNVESWNGTSWTEIAEINSARYAGAAAGSSNTDGLFFGGSPEPAGVTKNEQWDGSSWTELADMNQAKVYHAGCGTTNSALAFGGQSSSQIAKNEAWNGTAWTELADLASARNTLCGAGSTIAGLAYGGGSPGNATEEFTADNTLADVTVSQT